MNKEKFKIVIATGGSGGHLFPALKVAQELRKGQHDIQLIGSFGLGIEKIKKAGFSFVNLQAVGLTKGNILKKINIVGTMIKAIFSSFKILKQIKPDIVLGFGGYGAFPIVLSAVFLHIPTMIHEQNVVPGRANAILAHWVNKIGISFRQSQKFFKKNNTILTGCPIHLEIGLQSKMEILKKFQLEDHKFTILVFGGSQGSHRINEVFLQVVEHLKGVLDFQVIHISGSKDYTELKEHYSKLAVPFALFEFLDHIEDAYFLADVIISRAGASTITEIAMFDKPAILIPYPHAQSHQKENALILCESNRARLIEEQYLTTERLKNTVLEIKTALLRNELQDYDKDIYILNSTQRIAQELLMITNEKN